MRHFLVIAVLLLTPASAAAYSIDDGIVPQPKVRYFVGLKEWKKPMARVARALNRANVGVKLVKAKIAQQASIQIGRLDRQCGTAGVDATTLNLQGGYAVIYLPRNCNATQASILAAHELGHALGLGHEDRRCALMNSSGTGPNSIPTGCLGQSHPWRRKPWRSDDLAGLKRAYRNTKPKATLTGPSTGTVNQPVDFAFTATDREDNLSEVRFDFGDGETRELIAGEGYPTSHTYTAPGTYTIRATASDYYGKRATASFTVTIT